MITALPDIQSIDLEDGDDFFVLACDGIWNSKTNQQVIDFIRPRLAQSKSLSKICEEVSAQQLGSKYSAFTYFQTITYP